MKEGGEHKKTPLTHVFNKEEWEEILSCNYGRKDRLVRDYLSHLKISGNQGLPLPPILGKPAGVIAALNTRLNEIGLELKQVPPLPHRGPQERLYRLARKKL